MGLIGKLLSFRRLTRGEVKVSDVKLDPGGGPNITAEHAQAAGDDSHPLPGDYVIAIRIPRTGGAMAAGYVDPKNPQKAAEGERVLYARDPADGSVTVELWLKNDGTAILSNANGSATLNPDGSSELASPGGSFALAADGSQRGENGNGHFELQVGGDFNANGAKMTMNGDVVTSDGVSLRDHTHAQGADSAGDLQVETNKPTVPL